MSVRFALLTALLIAAGAPDALAQRICLPISAGDTAAQMAERLTGAPQGRHTFGFQIFDERWSVVSKSNYDRIQAGWLACIADDPGSSRPTGGLLSQAAPGALAAAGQPFSSPGLPMDVTLLFVAALVLGAVSLSRMAAGVRMRRRERAQVLRAFGAEFVREFGRPLTQFRGGAALPRARLRVSSGRSRVEVLLAPHDGQSYPNLLDHRRNVEYDVVRVMAALRRECFVQGRPYSEGGWVVVPIHYKGPLRQEGVR